MDKTRVTLVIHHPKGADTSGLIDSTILRMVRMINVIAPKGWKATLQVEVKRKKGNNNEN